MKTNMYRLTSGRLSREEATGKDKDGNVTYTRKMYSSFQDPGAPDSSLIRMTPAQAETHKSRVELHVEDHEVAKIKEQLVEEKHRQALKDAKALLQAEAEKQQKKPAPKSASSK